MKKKSKKKSSVKVDKKLYKYSPEELWNHLTENHRDWLYENQELRLFLLNDSWGK